MIQKRNKNNTAPLAKEWLPARIAILGTGKSGIAVAKYLIEQGKDIFISDAASSDKMEFVLATNGIAGVPHEANGHTAKVMEYELIICSPGIPSDIPVLKNARSRRIPVWSEIELAYRQSSAPYLAVTGSTGKSTTVELLGSICRAVPKQCVVAGNIGLPLIASAPAVHEEGFVVAEISSFQLENISLFRPRVAAILNLMKNHLDRYPGEEAYFEAKKAILRNMASDDFFVVNANDPKLCRWAEELKQQVHVVYFGKKMVEHDCVWHSDNHFYGRFCGNEECIGDAGAMIIKGNHNLDNACAAAAMALAVGINSHAIITGLTTFAGLPHRLEYIRTVNGVSFYNDSKATTAESVACAVQAFDTPVHLIAGGKDKGCDFSGIKTAIQGRVKSVCLIGEAAGRIAREWKGVSVITKAATLEEALITEYHQAAKGDVVVLSPGCSSFDMFSSFEERGMVFKKLVQEIV